jgi:hypothetical protein
LAGVKFGHGNIGLTKKQKRDRLLNGTIPWIFSTLELFYLSVVLRFILDVNLRVTLDAEGATRNELWFDVATCLTLAVVAIFGVRKNRPFRAWHDDGDRVFLYLFSAVANPLAVTMAIALNSSYLF